MSTMTPAAGFKDPIGPHEAAKVIGCGYGTLLRYIDAGRLTAVRPLGRGRGKPIILSRRQVQKFAEAYRVVTGSVTAK